MNAERDLLELLLEQAQVCRGGHRQGGMIYRFGHHQFTRCLALPQHRVSWSDRVLHVCDAHLDDAKYSAAHDSTSDRTFTPVIEPFSQSEIVTRWWSELIKKAEVIV